MKLLISLSSFYLFFLCFFTSLSPFYHLKEEQKEKQRKTERKMSSSDEQKRMSVAQYIGMNLVKSSTLKIGGMSVYHSYFCERCMAACIVYGAIDTSPANEHLCESCFEENHT
jgi:hypothetical protein